MKKRIFAVIVIIMIMALTIAGCGASKTKKSTSKNKAPKYVETPGPSTEELSPAINELSPTVKIELPVVEATPENIAEESVTDGNHHYYVYDLPTITNYYDALQYCIDLGGHMATITSQEENDFVYGYVKELGYKSVYFGLTDDAEEGNWVWSNGEPFEYVNWAGSEPNNEGGDENFGMFYYKFTSGTWNDGDFGKDTVNGGTAFICEWDY